LRVIIRHLLERALWRSSPEAREGEKKERIIKQRYLKEVARGVVPSAQKEKHTESSTDPLWVDEGRAQLEKWIKTE